jgi:hypothetical protein
MTDFRPDARVCCTSAAQPLRPRDFRFESALADNSCRLGQCKREFRDAVEFCDLGNALVRCAASAALMKPVKAGPARVCGDLQPRFGEHRLGSLRCLQGRFS